MRNTLVSILLIISSSLFVSCKKDGIATVSCGNLSCYQGGIGVLNTPQFDLGYVIALNLETHKTFGIRHLRYSANDVTQTPASSAYRETFNSSLNIAFSAEIPKEVSVSASNAIAKATQLVVTNYSLKSFSAPLPLLNSSQGLLDDVKQSMASNVIFIVITGVVPADYVGLGVTNSNDTSINANVLTYGDYKLTVDYKCNEEIQHTAKQAPAFFKYLAFKLSGNAIALDTSFAEDLSKYDFSPAGIR